MTSTSLALQDSRKCTTVLRLEKIPRPSLTAETMLAKLSSVRTMSEASLATSVPLPMATPMSAACRAGASFTPSPVMATISPRCCQASTILTLSSGSMRE